MNETLYDFYGDTSFIIDLTVSLDSNALTLACVDDAGNSSDVLNVIFNGKEGLNPPLISYVGGQSFSWPTTLNPYPLDAAKGQGEKLYVRFEGESQAQLVDSCFHKPQDSLFCPMTAVGLVPAQYDEGVCSNDYADTCLEDDDCDGEENKCVTALSATALCHCMMDLPAEERYELLFHVENEATAEYSAETEPVVVTLDQTAPDSVSCEAQEGVCPGDGAWCEQTDVRFLTLNCVKEPFVNACLRLNDEPACVPRQAYNSQTSFELEVELRSGLNSLRFLSQDIAGNLSDQTELVIERVAGPEIQIVYPSQGEVIPDASFEMEVVVDALDSQIALVEYCVGPSLSNCFTATCDGDEEVTTKSCFGGVELVDAINGLPYDILVRVANAADVQTTEEIVVLYLQEDVALSSMGPRGITIIQR